MNPALLLRLMLLAGAGAASYFFVRQGGLDKVRDAFNARAGTGKDVAVRMLLDPQCETYFPADEAVVRRVGRKRMRFCSKACADAYQEVAAH